VAAAGSGRTVILVREATSPDDIQGMEVSAGVLTSRGDAVCHAARVAREWGIPAVVGADAIAIGETGIEVAGRALPCGTVITIDGSTGEVFAGEVEGSTEVAPEAAALLAWAADLGISVDGDGTGPRTEAAPAESAGSAELCSDDVVRGLMIKGLVTPDGLAMSLACAGDSVAPLLDDLVSAGLAEMAAGSYRLTGEGKLKALDVFAAERERAGGEAVCFEALDHFIVLDHRMKDLVTAWQMRTVNGEQTFNDHTDAAYDASILDGLAALHADVGAWLAQLEMWLPRMTAYRTRLGAALVAARGGDGRYVASPRVDSYHSVWFELHEDLIRLAGRRRSDETAAGRA
jgi:pyruvate,orthophosphate dikinase